jgi:hypothetical protein
MFTYIQFIALAMSVAKAFWILIKEIQSQRNKAIAEEASKKTVQAKMGTYWSIDGH